MNYEIIKGSKILIIDDKPSNLSVIFENLDSRGSRVLLAQSGEKGLILAETEKPDIILLDIVMPDMDGYEVIRKLKEKKETEHIPVIFMTALADTENILKGFENGGIDYIIKPVEQKEVVARISTHLKLRKIEAQLIKAQKLESLGIMSAGIAHNFNNILGTILGFSELTLDMTEDKLIKSNIQQIISSTNRAAELSKKILTYSGCNMCIMEENNLSAIIREIAQAKEILELTGCNIKYELTENLPSVRCDPSKIIVILKHLIINASEATGDSNETITVKTGMRECDKNYLAENPFNENLTEGLYVYLEVEDKGSGIKEEIKDKIFDPFFTTRFFGRGLGLPEVMGIAKMHRGTVKIKSKDGKGTNVRVIFPACKKEI